MVKETSSFIKGLEVSKLDIGVDEEAPFVFESFVLTDELTADNCLKYAIGKFKHVALVAIDNEGEYYCASSEKNAKKVLKMLKEFKSTVKDYVDHGEQEL